MLPLPDDAVLHQQTHGWLHVVHPLEPPPGLVEEVPLGEGLQALGLDVADEVAGITDRWVRTHQCEGCQRMGYQVFTDDDGTVDDLDIDLRPIRVGGGVGQVQEPSDAGYRTDQFASPFWNARQLPGRPKLDLDYLGEPEQLLQRCRRQAQVSALVVLVLVVRCVDGYEVAEVGLVFGFDLSRHRGWVNLPPPDVGLG